MKAICLLTIVSFFLIACGNNNGPKLNYTEAVSEPVELAKDTSMVEVSAMPIYFDSTSYLIHPIGQYRMYGSGKKISFGSSSYGSGSFKTASFTRYDITGNLHNLKIQPLDSDVLKPLTTKNIRINRVSFLKDIFDSTKKQYLAFHVIDKDTNRDNELNNDDVETLYISRIDGSDFRKITTETHELIDWKVVKIKSRLYFRSVEDTNKNGEFDKDDQLHYQFIDFSKDDLEVVSYQPI